MASERLRRGVVRGVLLATGVGLRWWYLRHPNPTEGDPQLYANIARNLLLHGVYSFSPASAATLSPTLIRLPGYPLFLALIFKVFGIFDFAAVRWVQVVLDLLNCLLLESLTGMVFGVRAGLMAFGLGALCPFLANYTAAPLTETCTLLTITAAFWGLERWRRDGRWWEVVVIGGALAFSVLLRPEQGLLCVVVVGAMLAIARAGGGGGQRLAAVAVVAVMIVLPLLPWTARNWRAFHVVQPLAPHYATDPGELVPLGFQRWFRSWAVEFASTEEVYWSYDGTQIQVNDLPPRAFDTAAQRMETETLLADYNETVTPTAEFNQRFERLARERIRGHAARYYVLLPLARLANMLLRPRTELMNTQLAWWQWQENAGQAVFALGFAGLNLGYLVAGVWGAVRWWRTGESRALLGAMVAFVGLRCLLLLTLDNSEPRYTLEFFPVLIVGAAALIPAQWRASETARR